VRHLWQIAFTVISGIRMEPDLVRVTFVPAAPAGRRSPGHGLTPAVWGHQVTVTAFTNYSAVSQSPTLLLLLLLLLLSVLFTEMLQVLIMQVQMQVQVLTTTSNV